MKIRSLAGSGIGTARSKQGWMKYMLGGAVIVVCLGLLPAVLSAFEPVGPSADTYPYFDERGSVSLGVMHPFINTQLQVNRGNLVPGTFFDFESDLGLEGDEVRFFGDASWRIGKHASFGLTYLDISRSSTKTISKDIQIGERIFSASSTLNAFVNTKYYLLNYRYSFVRNAHNEFGASFGFNIADISAGLSLNTQYGGPIISTGTDRGKEVSFVAPVPLPGIYITAQILPKTFFRNSIQYIDLNISGYAFKSLNYMAGLDYNPFPNIGFGIGVYSNRLQIDTGVNIEGKFISTVNGTQVYARYFF